MSVETGHVLPTALAICLALQEGKVEAASNLLPQVQEELATASVEEQLRNLKNIFSLAIRKRQNAFFKQLLLAFQNQLGVMLQQQELMAEKENFLQFLVYTVCDRRLVGERMLVQKLVREWTRVAERSSLCHFWNEWSSLLARMVQRRWLGESEWLLTLMLKQLWRKQDLKLVQMVLWQLQLHLVMHARLEGIASTFIFYKPLFYSYLILVDRIKPAGNTFGIAESWLQTVIRSMRDIINQLARVQMVEQQEAYQAIYEQWLKKIKGQTTEVVDTEVPNEQGNVSKTQKLEQRMRLFLQLTVAYWKLTNPKSSKKQEQDLETLLQPCLLTPEWQALLQKLS